MKRTLTALFVALATACTPADVTEWFDGNISAGDAAAVAEWVNNRDCLPRYDESPYIECAVADAALQYGIDRATLADLVWCESRFDPEARNPRSTATGLAQFLDGTWRWVDELGAPFTHLPRTDARANAFTAAWLIHRTDLGGIGHWNASKGCWA